MQTVGIVPVVFVLLTLVAGIGLLLVRINSEQLEASSRSMPGFALFRFRSYRHSAAFICFCLAVIGRRHMGGAV